MSEDAQPVERQADDTSGRASFHWSADEIRSFGYEVVDLIAAHLSQLADRPVFRPVPPDVIAALVNEPLPEEGAPAESVLRDFARYVEPYPFGNGHPRFFAWVNSPPSPIGVFGEALGAAMNPSVAGGNHAAVFVERGVLNWFKAILGFPEQAMGSIVSGGSMATLTALAAARHAATAGRVRADGLAGTDQQLVVYQGSEGHGCIQKAVELLGIGADNLRLIASDASRRIRVEELEAAILADKAAGKRPMAIVATAGTVNTGAIDPLARIGDVARRHNVWFHVDGAYGAPAIVTSQYAAELAPIADADSIAIDPHKWLSVPVAAGLVLVRDAALLRESFSLVPPYLQTAADETGVGGPPWFAEYGFAQTRPFWALKVWMMLKHHGRSGYRAAIEADLALADRLTERIAASQTLELVDRGLSVVCFRAVPSRSSDVDLDDHNKAVLEWVQLSGEAFLSGTVLDGSFTLRACLINHRTTDDDIARLVRAVERASQTLAVEQRGPDGLTTER